MASMVSRLWVQIASFAFSESAETGCLKSPRNSKCPKKQIRKEATPTWNLSMLLVFEI